MPVLEREAAVVLTVFRRGHCDLVPVCGWPAGWSSEAQRLFFESFEAILG